MKRIAPWLAALLSIALLAACSTAPTSPSAPSQPSSGSASAPSQPAKPAAGEPRTFPLLRVAVEQEPPGLDIMWQTASMTQDVMQHVYEYLFTQDHALDFKPMLAEKMDISPDGKTFTISLRKGVKFHNGKEMTAEDVTASLRRWIRLDSRARGMMKTMSSMGEKDKYTVEVVFSAPNGAFLSGLAIHNNIAAIMPKEIVEKYWNPDPRGKEITDLGDLIGTGPYKLAEWARDRHIRLIRFDDYVPRSDPASGMAGKRTAWADEIRFITVKDSATRLNGLISGEYDVAHTLSAAQHGTVKANPNLAPIIVKPGSAPTAVFNKSPGNLFSNEKLRNAVHWSIDYAVVMAGSYDDDALYRADFGLAPAEYGFWHNEAGKEYFTGRDLEKAKKLMAEAGYKGEKIRWITPRDRDSYYRSSVVASEQMKEAGFNVELIAMDFATVVSTRSKPEAYEIFSTGIGFSGDPTATAAFTPNWPGFYNDPVNNTNYQALVSTADPAKRKAVFEEQQRLFYQKNPYLRFGSQFSFRAARKNVKGLIDRGPAYFWNVWIEQ